MLRRFLVQRCSAGPVKAMEKKEEQAKKYEMDMCSEMCIRDRYQIVQCSALHYTGTSLQKNIGSQCWMSWA